jgi:hypothetical protein
MNTTTLAPEKAASDINTTYKLYTQRWFVLLSYSILSFSSSWIWISWSPFTLQLSSQVWTNEPPSAIDDLSGVYMYIYFLGSMFAQYLVVSYLGLRYGLIIAGGCNCLGAYIRWIGWEEYKIVYGGTFICAVAQLFILSAPPAIASQWFGETERVTAISVGILSNQLGVAIGLAAPFLYDFTWSMLELDIEKLVGYLKLQWYVASISFLLVVIFVKNEPPTPPNYAASLTRRASSEAFFKQVSFLWDENDESNISYGTMNNTVLDEETLLFTKTKKMQDFDMESEPPSTTLSIMSEMDGITRSSNSLKSDSKSSSFLKTASMLYHDTNFLLFLPCFGLSVGVYYTLPVVLSQLFPTWTPHAIGCLGIVYKVAGAIASFFSGVLLDKTASTAENKSDNAKFLVQSSLVVSFICFGLYYILTVLFQGNNDSSLVDCILPILITLAGTVLSIFATIGVEIATNMSYPADEATVAASIECIAEMFGFLLVAGSGFFANTTTMIQETSDPQSSFEASDHYQQEAPDVAARNIALLLTRCLGASILILCSIQTQGKRPTMQ